MELWLTVNGKRTCASAPLDPLTRAVVISLFTWRRAEPDDNADVPMGWWGDTWPAVQNDRYGSRLWLLQRSKLTNQLVQTVRGYTSAGGTLIPSPTLHTRGSIGNTGGNETRPRNIAFNYIVRAA